MTVPLKQKNLFTGRWRTVKLPEPLEAQVQKAVVAHLQLRCRPDVVWWHTPNGGYRFKITAALLKALGVIPGVPDLIFICPQLVSVVSIAEVQTMSRVLGLELKTRKGKLTSHQNAFAARMRRAGAAYETANNIDDAIAILEQYGIMR
jgi:hypothetical protein